MSFVNMHEKKIHCKIVYYGPGLGGKTSCIQHIYQKTAANNKSDMVTLNTDTDRTIFFDFLPLNLGQIRGFETRFHLYTVPGQVFYEASRKLILRGVDGVIFVADSQENRREENIASFKDLERNLKAQGYNINTIPLVIQYNKRDLSNILPVEYLRDDINKLKSPDFETCAISGEGVFEALKEVSKRVLMNIRSGI